MEESTYRNNTRVSFFRDASPAYFFSSLTRSPLPPEEHSSPQNISEVPNLSLQFSFPSTVCLSSPLGNPLQKNPEAPNLPPLYLSKKPCFCLPPQANTCFPVHPSAISILNHHHGPATDGSQHVHAWSSMGGVPLHPHAAGFFNRDSPHGSMRALHSQRNISSI